MPDQPGQPVQFEIVDQTHDYSYNPDGTQSGRWTVTFKTPSGVSSQVIIPDSHYNAKNVGQAIAHQVRTIEEVHALNQAHPPAMQPPAANA